MEQYWFFLIFPTLNIFHSNSFWNLHDGSDFFVDVFSQATILEF